MTIRVLGWLAALSLLAGLLWGFGVAPREVTQGNVQRIMYLHVPSAIVGEYVGFGVLLFASIAYLLARSEFADRVAQASAEVGVLLLAITIVSGSIWGKPTWGTWWTWDARLTTVTILFVMGLGYLLLRGMIEDGERAARFAAVLGILAPLNVPLVHFSVYWWRTLHQPPSLLKPGPSMISGRAAGFWGFFSSIEGALAINLAAFLLLYAYLVAKRVRLLQREVEALA